jgi:hypothetical protein
MAIHLDASLDVLATQPLFSTMEISGKRENYDPTLAFLLFPFSSVMDIDSLNFSQHIYNSDICASTTYNPTIY